MMMGSGWDLGGEEEKNRRNNMIWKFSGKEMNNMDLEFLFIFEGFVSGICYGIFFLVRFGMCFRSRVSYLELGFYEKRENFEGD